MNHELIQEEQANNAMSIAQLEDRMSGWLDAEYQVILFEQAGSPVAYALFRPDEYGVYLRHFFVERTLRRAGIGRSAIGLLVQHVFPKDKRVTVEAYVHNQEGLEFWRGVRFKDHALALKLHT